MTHPLDWIEPLLLGELDDEHTQALEQWLLADEANCAVFLREVQLCQDIRRSLIVSDSGQALDATWEDETELPPEDDTSDVMSIVVAQALAERRKHELEDEANRQLAQQQAEQAEADRYKLRRPGNAPARRELVTRPSCRRWVNTPLCYRPTLPRGHRPSAIMFRYSS